MVTHAPLFSAWLDAFFAAYYRRHPVNATFIGVHDYDHALPDRSEQGLQDGAAESRDLLVRLAALPPEPLSAAAAIDRDLARGYLEIQAWEFEGPHMHRGNPSLALGEAIFGAISLVLRPFAPLTVRLTALEARLEAIPSYLAQVQETVRAAPAAWTARAMRECQGLRAFLGPGLQRLLAEAQLDGAGVRRAADRALAATARFEDVLRALPAGGSAGCGEEALALIASRAHWLAEDLATIEVLAEAQAAEAEGRLRAQAAALGAASWQQALTLLETAHPAAQDYLSRFDQIWTAAREAAIAHDLLTWPQYPIRYVQQYRWAREAAPFLYFLPYRAPAAFDEVTPMEYQVPPLDADLPREERERRLRAVNDSVITLNHVVHHGGLGHHVQNFHAYRAASRIGRVAAVDCASRIAMLCGGSMAEGWACYATELMQEIGFLTPLQILSEEQSRLRMATRALADIRLHRGQYTLEQTAALYRERTAMSDGAALAEAVKNSMFPGAALMYMMGVEGIRRLRAEAEAHEGSAFSLGRFHDRLLAYGSIPIARIAQALRQEQAEAQQV